ncbi:putative ATP-dependent helicase IRC5 [Nakaseomyces bracarensis]|uniref:ATP-dependent helicase IRC5 n=1 Tax=Nakaseomyces bracarensis TaxID=273131 RepID=A0ABR4NW73_9SACH
MSTGRRYLRSSRKAAPEPPKYKEVEEDDLSSDTLVSEDEDVVKTIEDTPPVWLRDDTVGPEDVLLDSDEEDKEDNDNYLDELLIKEQGKHRQGDGDSESNDDDEEDVNDMDKASVALKLKKLDEFVKQSQVYSSIIADTLLKRTLERSEEEEAKAKEEMDEPPKKKVKTSRSIFDFFKKRQNTDDNKETVVVKDQKSEEERISQEQPSLLKNCVLKPYQMEGLNWLITLYENGLNGILADEMGLGKTIQSIALLAFIYEMDTKGPFLVAAPLSTVDNWINEFERFAPGIPVLKYYSQSGFASRQKLLKNFFRKNNKEGVVITSYEMIIRDSNTIMSEQWKFLIVDEGHRLKNINCRLIQELKRINTSNRLLLTGTPLQNNLSELWSLLNFILPDIFADFEIFNKWFDFKDLDLQSNSAKLNKLINDELEKNLISNLHSILKPFLLRRLKSVVLKDVLPPKREYIVNCPLSHMQRKFYKMALSGKLKVTIFKELVKSFFTLNQDHIGTVSNKSIRDFIEYKLDKDSLDKPPTDILKQMNELYMEHLNTFTKNQRLQNMMMQLRQIVDSTLLFYFPYIEPEELTLDFLLASSGKLQMLQKLVIPLIRKGHKVLIFSQFVNMLDLLEDWTELNDLKSLRIDGGVDNSTRKEYIEKFNDKNDKHQVFLLSTRAAGLGINLVAADTVILFDSDWNPQVDLQAMDRCHRIGQTKPVVVYRLCCDNTIEHVILTRAVNKRKLERMVIQMGKFNNLKKLALNERSFLQQRTGSSGNVTSNKELVQELSQLLVSKISSIGFETNSSGNDDLLTKEEFNELTNRSLSAYAPNREVDLPHIRLFETSSGF